MSYQFPRNVTVKHSGYKNTFDGTYFSVSRTVVDLIHEIGISYLFFRLHWFIFTKSLSCIFWSTAIDCHDLTQESRYVQLWTSKSDLSRHPHLFKVNILEAIKGARLASSDVYFSFRVRPLTIFNSIEDY